MGWGGSTGGMGEGARGGIRMIMCRGGMGRMGIGGWGRIWRLGQRRRRRGEGSRLRGGRGKGRLGGRLGERGLFPDFTLDLTMSCFFF